MNLRKILIKLEQAQLYNSYVIKAFINQLQRDSIFSRSTNFFLWALFHAARVTRIKWLYFRRGYVPTSEVNVPWQNTLSASSHATLGNRVLIIAELSLIQCKKYRVTQKVEMLSLLSYETTVLSWSDYVNCRNALQTHGIVIFYRTPATPELEKLIIEARRLGVVSLFDIDDLVFDLEEYRRNNNVQKLPKSEYAVLMEGARLYKNMLQLTDHAIASTSVIAERMRPLCRGNVFVLENALDKHLLNLVAQKYPPSVGEVIIGYGSGSRTHDADFGVAASALLRILQAFPKVRLVIYGHLTLPKEFSCHMERVLLVPFIEPDDYYLSLARFSINLAPLEESEFNHAKSNIKFLEAAVFGVPSVCSPVAAFQEIIRHGENGFLARTTEEWFVVLSQLIVNADLRHRVGEAARQELMNRYAPEIIAKQQLLPIVTHVQPPIHKEKFRILIVNLLFAPMSFGGATIVAEQLAVKLAAMPGTEVCVFTACSHTNLAAYELIRYEWQGVPVIAAGFPAEANREADYDNQNMMICFEKVLRAVQPDIVHFHSIQIVGATLAEICSDMHIPYVITLHDAWWLCERQFMVRSDGNYCNQEGVDVTICSTSCTSDAAFTHHRYHKLWMIMMNASLLLAPSKFQKNLYVRSGVPPDHIRINKNGIVVPERKRISKNNGHLTFAFLGGRAIHKGYFFLREVFSGIDEKNYTLRLVDVENRLGGSKMAADTWQVTGKLEIVQPFDQERVDEFYCDIDVLLFPSLWKESFGLTVREAMARDVWVIATDCGGPMEDIINGENGDIVTIGDVDAFRSAIVELLQNPTRIANYHNPHAAEIRYFQQQATELLDILREVSCHSTKK